MAPPDAAGTDSESHSGSDTDTGAVAAIFDLDRTLLTGASGPMIGAALREVGLLPGGRTGIEALAFKVFDLIGETLPAMLLTRQGARAARGWSVELVEQAAKLASEPLADAVAPYAHLLFDEHRREGRLLVLATTTPVDLVRPMAERLGFDEVIATRYGRDGGAYDGRIEGRFVWGRDKAEAVRDWAEANSVDLGRSFAYSDSYYDIPLLSLVGNPRAVNPDPRMLAVAALRRWPVVHLDVPDGVPKLLGVEPQRAAMLLAQPQLMPWVRFDIEGLDNIPLDGAAVVVANHRSYFDALAVGYLLSKRGRTVRFLGKKEVFDAPIVGDMAKAFGGIRVDRGTGSEEPLAAAEEALRAGQMVALMPQGTIPRGPAFFDPVLKGRWGAARLARATGAAIVPVGLWGTERVWPRSARTPNMANVLSPPTVRIRVGEPFHLQGAGRLGDDEGVPTETDGATLDADTEAIMAAIVDLLPPEARVRRTPTRAELAATYPNGSVPDDVDLAAEHEADRRPGTD